MSEDIFPIRILKPIPILVITLSSLGIAFGVSSIALPGHGRIVFFASIMAMFSVYSAADMLKIRPIFAFVVMYIALHVILCFSSALTDQGYYGAALIPASIVDYIAFVYILYGLYKHAN